MTVLLQRKSCYSEKTKYLENFFPLTKKDKDEFNTMLKHLIKLVKKL